ncbi:MAG: tetratricopeptide repeat protein [Chitinivibrionales bacterium]|nr:tetratricopeptide repeat protein [Chitinivibrionales bacterium]
MKHRTLAYLFRSIAFIAIVSMLLPDVAAGEAQTDEWRVRQNLASRLEAEWYKIGILNRELSNVRDVLGDIRSLQLFPLQVTGLNEETLIVFDEKIEQVEEEYESIHKEVEALRAPLADAIAILREMVVGQPVPEMFEALKEGDFERINKMLEIKHRIDGIWFKTGELLDYAMEQMDIPVVKMHKSRGIKGEFMEIIRANLGLQSQEYYSELNIIKDTLFNRGTKQQVDEMFLIEIHQIKRYLENNKAYIAVNKLPVLLNRYKSKEAVDELTLLLSRSYFATGQYIKAISTTQTLPSNTMYKAARVLYTVQSKYALQRYNEIMEWASSFDFLTLTGRNRNTVLWLTMESGLKSDGPFDAARLAALAAQDAPGMFHVMHTLARSFIKAGDYKTALSVLERGIRFKPLNESDEKAYDRMLISIAQVNYETGNYDKALSLYFDLLEKEENYEKCLFGMTWCYIELEKYGKAETSLRKLINQSPDNPNAVEAILILAERYVNKAEYEWKKLQYLDKQERNLGRLHEDLQRKMVRANGGGAKKERLADAVKETRHMLNEIRSAPKESIEEIASHYKNALAICSMVEHYYTTGTFQEATFSVRREKLLHQLVSLMLAVKEKSTNAIEKKKAYMYAKRDVEKIKSLVTESSYLSAETQIDRYRWELESLEWKKEKVKYAEKQLEKRPDKKDRIAVAEYKRKKIRYGTMMDSLVSHEEYLNEKRYKEIRDICLSVLTLPLNSSDEAYIRYHLGEQYYSYENRQFSELYREYERQALAYDSLLALFRKGEILEKPVEPLPPDAHYHSASIEQFKMVIDNYPDDPLIPAVKYSLAWCYNDMGIYDKALDQMESVAMEYAQSRYAPQAWMYIGEHAFDNAQLKKATEAYKQVMNYPESRWFDEALYKYAWSQYRQSNPEKAISSFLALVDLGKRTESGKSILEKESMDYIAISFSEADITGEKGLERAAKFIERFGNNAQGRDILHRLASVYKDQGRHDMAEKAYRTVMTMFPNHPSSPVVEKELLAVLENKKSTSQINRMKVDYFKQYNRNGTWAAIQNDQEAIARGDSLAREVLYDAAISRHQMALQNNDAATYHDAMESYDAFIRNYPQSPRANECHYNYAEIMFSLGDYLNAAEEYMAVSRRYPNSKYKETAAWNAIVASQNLLRLEQERLK